MSPVRLPRSSSPPTAGLGPAAVDLGIDQIVQYRPTWPGGIDLEAVGGYDAPAGSGPRHFTFHPIDPATGQLEHRQVHSTLPSEFGGENLGAEVAVHPSGRFVYVSNRGHNSLAIFRYDGPQRGLAPIAHASSGGSTPRHFADWACQLHHRDQPGCRRCADQGRAVLVPAVPVRPCRLRACVELR